MPNFSSALISLYDVVEVASRRIAQRLHDESAQLLAVVYLELADIARDRPANLSERIGRAVSHLDDVKEQLRLLAYELRPLILDRYGLVPALHELAKGMGARCGLDVTIVGDELDRLDPEMETVLYRTVQESLANVFKHAKASHVGVRLWKERNSVICTISDNGIGFPQYGGETSVCAGIGLIGIHERARTMAGSCVILSRPGGGSTIKVEIPI